MSWKSFNVNNTLPNIYYINTQSCYLARANENEISLIENPTHSMPMDVRPNTVVIIWQGPFTIYQYVSINVEDDFEKIAQKT